MDGSPDRFPVAEQLAYRDRFPTPTSDVFEDPIDDEGPIEPLWRLLDIVQSIVQ